MERNIHMKNEIEIFRYLIIPSLPFLLLFFFFHFCYVFIKDVSKEAIFPNQPAQKMIPLYFLTDL